MEFDYKLSDAEMREAFRMNQSWKFWVHPLRKKLHLSLMIIAFVLGIALDVVEHQQSTWANLSILLGPEVLVLVVFWWRVSRSVSQMAVKVNAATATIRLGAFGIETRSRNGSTTSVPWSHYDRWNEGKLVFTAGSGKTFRTIPKRALSEMQIGEVRGILQTQIRS